MRLLLLLLLPIIGYCQPSANITYHIKEVHNIGWRTADSTSSWRIDTIKYSSPFEIKLSDKSVAIDGYGSFKVDSVKQKYNSLYWNYWLSGGKQFSLIENLGYLNYPTVNKKSQIIIFYID